MVSADDLAAAFAVDGTPIRKADVNQIQGRVPDQESADTLANVGLPEQLGYEIFLSAIHRRLITKGEGTRERGRSEVTEVDDMFSLGSGPNAGIILLDGATGTVHSWKEGHARLINSKLDKFVEFLRRIQLEINSFEEQGWPEDERTDGYVQRLLRELQEIDPEPFPPAGSFWETILKAIFLSTEAGA